MPLLRCVAFLPLLLLLGCGPKATNKWPVLELVRYQVPLRVKAPSDAEVTTRSMSGLVQDVTITSPSLPYAVQVFAGRAYTNDVFRLKAFQLDLVRENPYFKRIVREEPAGFIFENQVDSTATFGFRYVHFQGDQEIIFQNGMGSIFTQDQAEAMFDAVRQ